MTVRISLIVAVADNGVIGSNGGLPWRMSSDLKTFRRLTMGKPVVMGRKTFLTLKKPLDGRDNIVVTRDASFERDGVTAVQSVDDALIIARTLARTSGADEVMVIGGAEIYSSVLPRADRIYWTQVHAAPAGDVVFPPLNAADWTEVSAEALPQGERDDHAATLKVLDRHN